MLDYPSLFALATVVREGSFERAARQLHVTPSAVSQRIRLLEERVGCTLVTRSQPCEATEAGRRLCQHADRIRLLEHELQNEMPAFTPSQQAHVRIPVAVNADSLATWFVPALAVFTQQLPALVALSVDDEGHTAQRLQSGTVLAAVTARGKPVAGCNSRLLGHMRYVAAASPTFVLNHFGEGVDINSLALAPSLVFNAKDELQQRWVQVTFGRALTFPHHTLPSTHAFLAATLMGMGWAVHPLALAKEKLQSGELVELVPDKPLDVPLYWQQARVASSLMEALTQAVVAAARAELIQV